MLEIGTATADNHIILLTTKLLNLFEARLFYQINNKKGYKEHGLKKCFFPKK